MEANHAWNGSRALPGMVASACSDKKQRLYAERESFIVEHKREMLKFIPNITPLAGNDPYWKLILDPRYEVCFSRGGEVAPFIYP